MRALVFLLASLSFAALLGQFYGLWPMQGFALLVMLPGCIWLGVLAWGRPWIAEGAVAGLVAAVAYDLYRLPFVLSGAPLFKVFPRFGELLLGSSDPAWLVQVLGWSYHFLNGASLGVMLLAMVPGPRGLFWAGVIWGLVVEGLLLATPYADFFGLAVNARFLFLTASAHLVFGLALGAWLHWRSKQASWSAQG